MKLSSFRDKKNFKKKFKKNKKFGNFSDFAAQGPDLAKVTDLNLDPPKWSKTSSKYVLRSSLPIWGGFGGGLGSGTRDQSQPMHAWAVISRH